MQPRISLGLTCLVVGDLAQQRGEVLLPPEEAAHVPGVDQSEVSIVFQLSTNHSSPCVDRSQNVLLSQVEDGLSVQLARVLTAPIRGQYCDLLTNHSSSGHNT